LAGKTVAVARDAAFCFIYAANLDTLRALGAQVVFFSPLANDPVPTCDAIWLPGGYPELHAETLSISDTTRDSLVVHVNTGRPVWAECGGMMVLFDAIVDLEGRSHVSWGLFPGVVRMQPRLAALGPQKLELATGELRGHTFHYSVCETALEPVLHTASARGGAKCAGEAVYQRGALRASYFHAWMASSPTAAAALFLPEVLA
jgi:cobyrinic acid a,c-diamide synthase